MLEMSTFNVNVGRNDVVILHGNGLITVKPLLIRSFFRMLIINRLLVPPCLCFLRN